jgi:hypothetical protein
VAQFEVEASRTRDYCVAKNATLRAARLDPSLRKKRLFRMTIKLSHYLIFAVAPFRIGALGQMTDRTWIRLSRSHPVQRRSVCEQTVQSFLCPLVVRVQLYGFLIALYGQVAVTVTSVRFPEAVVDIGGIRIGFHVELEYLDCCL